MPKLTYTEKIIIGIIFFILIKFLDKKFQLENFLLIISLLGIIFLSTLKIVLKKIFTDLSSQKISFILIVVFLAFALSIPFGMNHLKNKPKTPPVFYEGYIDDKKFYTDDIETLLLLNRALYENNQEIMFELYLTGKVHITKGLLSGKFYQSSPEDIVSVTFETSYSEPMVFYTLRIWTHEVRR